MNSEALCCTLYLYLLNPLHDFEHKFSEMTHFTGEERENGIGHLKTTRYIVIGPCPLYFISFPGGRVL